MRPSLRPKWYPQHLGYWEAIVNAIDTNEFGELMGHARQAGSYQFLSGIDVSEAVRRTVEATNMIEIALLGSERR